VAGKDVAGGGVAWGGGGTSRRRGRLADTGQGRRGAAWAREGPLATAGSRGGRRRVHGKKRKREEKEGREREKATV
jgi:hypothetical protein